MIGERSDSTLCGRDIGLSNHVCGTKNFTGFLGISVVEVTNNALIEIEFLDKFGVFLLRFIGFTYNSQDNT